MTCPKLVYIVSDVDKALSFEWLAADLKQAYDLSFILIGAEDTHLEKYLRQQEIRVHVIADAKYPGTLRKWLRLFFLLAQERPVIVHSHLWRATLLSMPASWMLRIRRRVFTRHHATTHYDQYPSGRKWDRLCNLLATDIIAISKSIHIILKDWDKADNRKIRIVQHGFQLHELYNVNESRSKAVRSKYKINEDDYPVVGAVSRYTSWKGIQYILSAFRHLKERYPSALLILANAHGDYIGAIRQQLSELNADSYREIIFENDLPALYAQMDVYVHVPINSFVEAFGQTYVEAMACGVPSVFTLSGVAPEFIVHEHNALVVPFKDAVAIEEAVVRLLEDERLRERLIENGKKSIASFSFEKMMNKLKTIYGT